MAAERGAQVVQEHRETAGAPSPGVPAPPAPVRIRSFSTAPLCDFLSIEALNELRALYRTLRRAEA